jgi:hypothetical protein
MSKARDLADLLATVARQSDLPTVPTSVSELTNDTGFITGVAFSEVTAKPTTLSGYGITDAATATQGAKADTAVQPTHTGNVSITGTISATGQISSNSDVVAYASS